MDDFEFEDISYDQLLDSDEESVKCNFCSDDVGKSKIREHIKQHVSQWNHSDMKVKLCDSDEVSHDAVNDDKLMNDMNDSTLDQTVKNDNEILSAQAASRKDTHGDISDAVKNESSGLMDVKSTDRKCLKCEFCLQTIYEIDKEEHIKFHEQEWKENADIAIKKEIMFSDNNPTAKTDFISSITNRNHLSTEILKGMTIKIQCSFCQETFFGHNLSKHTMKHINEWKIDIRENEELRKKIDCSFSEKSKAGASDCLPEDGTVCSFCKKFVPNIFMLKHTRKHFVNIESHRYFCQHCGRNYVDKKSLVEHERVHTGEFPLKCTLCFKSFRLKQSLKVHIKTAHTDDKFSCDKCGLSFNYSRGLLTHMTNQHADISAYKCKECGQLFRTLNGLNRHSQKPCYKKCPHCDKSFKRIASIKIHLESHLDNEDRKHWVCDECGKSFGYKSVLMEHERSHSNAKEFKCSECGKGFNRKGGLWAHRAIHKKFMEQKDDMVMSLGIKQDVD